ncbi:hypothetical protein DB35_04185 [Streptomyces abyssalis]|uniref:Uncharacterized protein n=2 Tax=Streptomyces abyssalis TaxID=933944 RepID=A0A1E7JRE6_9ACTN|nr:hypothetical protein AN215_13295 [Streptomyces abyssalis]OEU95422.1 hypothetical protein DB35_04185 [Streptomyces abyssalis]
MTGSDASPASAGTSQDQAQNDKDKRKKAHAKAKRHHAKAKRHAKHPPKGDGAKALCKRAPKIDKKIDRVQRRLDGGLKTRGSIERLERRVENAKKANHGVIADFLGERLDDRGELKLTLKEREEGLKKVRAWCATQDFEKDKDKDKGEKNSSGESSEG